MFEDSKLSSESGKTMLWNGLFNIGLLLEDQKYLVYDKLCTLKFTIDKRTILIRNKETFLFSMTIASLTEQTHAKVTENKYSQLIVSTITHDLKSPMAVIKGNLTLLEQYIEDKGLIHLKTAKMSASTFEYYLYDLIVSFEKRGIGFESDYGRSI